MDRTLIIILAVTAYLAVAAATWRPMCRWLYPACLDNATRWGEGTEAAQAQRALRSAGLQATAGALLWPYVGFMLLLFKIIPPVYRRVMDAATAGVLPERAAAEPDKAEPTPAAAPGVVDPVAEVVAAWTGTGADPTWHGLHRHEVAERMPDLAQALNRLTESCAPGAPSSPG
jgi:hypothetical protein